MDCTSILRRSIRRRVAGEGPNPIISAPQPATAQPRIRMRGVKPRFSACWRVIITSAAAPSLMPDELAAVTTPSALNAGRSVASFSRGVSRGCSSVANRRVAFFCRPAPQGPGSARESDPPRSPSAPSAGSTRAKSSIASRVIPKRCATFSAVMPL